MKPKTCEQCETNLPKHPWANVDPEQYGDHKKRWFCSEDCVDASYQARSISRGELINQLRACAEYFERDNSAFGVRMAKNLRASMAKAEGKA